ncbi:MAG: tRNA preQ1(34) S-adenosylmethionine ribosyltransferase-isomerase QueA [Planctomycetota bacterium]|nr:tRNA preQ1(34) S-adenosylmethionine ribosyltransferase-isomerase QueA [Planctomycetota bacterium]MDI6788018.1 tRNA preQ1(34) S-adenosylmethionine ribosyltransferase-isomerase QueA [Planctomycetota bacterium]
MKLSELEYALPRELIAQKQVKPRDNSRLLVLNRSIGEIADAGKFYNIIRYLQRGDILVLNNTHVVPARLIGERKSGGMVEVLVCKQDSEDKTVWQALLNNSHLKEGETLRVISTDSRSLSHWGSLQEGETITITLLKKGKDGWLIRTDPAIDISTLQRIGKMPLPPYIKRDRDNDPYLERDKRDYQTVYAEEIGSIAAPTAGLHFTNNLLKKLSAKGITIVYITLHIGIGTFKPIRAENLEDHQMQREYFEVSSSAMRVLSEGYAKGRKVIAVGTSVCRVLETIADNIKTRMIHPLLEKQRVLRATLTRGWTDLFIHPPYRFKMVNALITNFHLPHGTPLALACAFAGREMIMKAYQRAIEKQYRFYSYGDAMLII